MADLFDVRQELFRESFGKALHFKEYLAQAKAQESERWNQYLETVRLTSEQEKSLKSWTRRMNLLVLSGSWCGDCARQGPIIERLASCSDLIELRFAESSQFEKLALELRIHGASRVPVALVLSEDFFEVARFGDRTLSSYLKKARTELGPSCEIGLAPSDPKELDPEVQEWFEILLRGQLLLRLSSALRARYQD